LKLTTKLQKIVGEYRNILALDGIIKKEQLIKMLKVDEEIESDVDYDYLAEKILYNIEEVKGIVVKPYNSPDRIKAHNEKMELYKKGLVDREIGEILNLNYTAIWHWRKKYKLPPVGVRGGKGKKRK